MSVLKFGGFGNLPQSVTVYVGAGGGGDTLTALARSLSQVDGEKHVLGAGYDEASYLETLKKDAINRNAGVLERVKVSPAAAEDYVNSVMKYWPGRGKTFWTVCAYSEIDSLMEAATPQNKPNVKELQHSGDDWKSDLHETSGFTYKTMFAEAKAAALGYTFDMFTSTDKASETDPTYKAMLDALANYFDFRRATKVVILDVGGDIIKPAKTGRDVAVLKACMQVCATMGIEACVEVYGMGCDGEDAVKTVFSRIPLNAEDMQDSEFDRFRHILLDPERSPFLVAERKPGRATGNFIMALQGTDYPTFEAYVESRNEFSGKTKTDADRAAFSASNGADPERTMMLAKKGFRWSVAGGGAG